VRILILGDSLSFPRPHRGQPVATTWPTLLKAQLPAADIWLRAQPRSCILDVLKELSFFTDSLPDFDVVIVQTGIVDCAPRPYPRWLYKLIETFLGMAKLRRIERFAHEHLLWMYNRPWVGTREFVRAVQEIAATVRQRNPRARTVFIPIAAPSRTIVQSLPGIDHAAAAYNKILLREIAALGSAHSCQCVDPFAQADPFDVTIEDGHHLSVAGHRLIAEALARLLNPAIAPEHPMPAPSPAPAQPAAKPIEPISLSLGKAWPVTQRASSGARLQKI
jgi:lysophospholipase L1-like esterase